MKTEPYARFKDEDLILRDYLAADRTVLANERTLLSYTRTALAFAATGAALIHFFDSLATEIVGWALIPIAVAGLLVGSRRYLEMKRRLDRALNGRGSTEA